MLHKWNKTRRETVARQIVLDSRAYRTEVQNPSWKRHLRYPNHGLAVAWTPAILEGYGEFVGIRIYRMTYETSADGTEITAYDEELLLEAYPFGTPARHPPANTEPPESINRTTPDAENAYGERWPRLYPIAFWPTDRARRTATAASSGAPVPGVESPGKPPATLSKPGEVNVTSS